MCSSPACRCAPAVRLRQESLLMLAAVLLLVRLNLSGLVEH